MQLTDEQQNIVDKAVDWYFNSSEQVFQFSGNPGTGKSLVMNSIIQSIGLDREKVAPMSYVGAAAIVMRMNGLLNAKTIHSWLYDPVEVPILNKNGEIIMDTYYNKPRTRIEFVPKDLHEIDLMAIDEGSTVPLHMKKDIESRGKKIIVAGDLDQLNPVNDEPAYLTSGTIYVLTQIMRQNKNSAIIYLSQLAKQGSAIHTGLYGNDVLVITEDEITNDMLRWSDVLLCGKNITRDMLNNTVRYNILEKQSELPEYGEKLICRKNNWTREVGGISLTNGLTGVILNNPDPSTFDGKIFNIDFLPNLTRLKFDNVQVDYKYFIASNEERRMIKESKYSIGDKFEYGYAQTVHLAQGGQWTHGMYFEEYLNPSINNRLNYTALSRFSKRCIYVKKK